MAEWEEVEQCVEEEERMFLLRELLRRLPVGNHDNIAVLFRFLAKLGRCGGGGKAD